MDREKLNGAIDAAFATQVAELYRALAQAVVAAGDDTTGVAAAREQFRAGLAVANRVRVYALEAAGL